MNLGTGLSWRQSTCCLWQYFPLCLPDWHTARTTAIRFWLSLRSAICIWGSVFASRSTSDSDAVPPVMTARARALHLAGAQLGAHAGDMLAGLASPRSSRGAHRLDRRPCRSVSFVLSARDADEPGPTLLVCCMYEPVSVFDIWQNSGVRRFWSIRASLPAAQPGALGRGREGGRELDPSSALSFISRRVPSCCYLQPSPCTSLQLRTIMGDENLRSAHSALMATSMYIYCLLEFNMLCDCVTCARLTVL